MPNPVHLLFAALLALGLASTTAQAQLPQPVPTTLGLVQGEPATSGSMRMSVFRGLPYAAPPVGENRWREPQPAASWSGVRMADRLAPRCVQRGFAVGADQAPASEDCLYLNVWTPAANATAALPVLVWIHGGGFFAGSGGEATTTGTNLASHGAVVVAINYRLGAFGFFAHPQLTAESPHHSSGNYGILDMLAALQWVKANITAFGGNPDNVTIVGESAGAYSVGALIASPLSAGLFKRAILQSFWSGFFLNPQPTLAARETQGNEQMQKFGAVDIAHLRQATTQQIFEKLPVTGAISVDGYLLPKTASLIFAAGTQQPVDVLAGSNSNEAAFFGPGPQTLAALHDYANRFGILTDAFARLYPAADNSKIQPAYYQAFSTEMAWHAHRLARYQKERGQHAYVYYFSRVPPGQEARGATHVSELAYVFNQLEQNPKWTDVDRALSGQMAQYWVNFAASGNPNGKDLPTWAAYTPAARSGVMALADKAATMKDKIPAAAEMDFFDKAYINQLKSLQP
jgi:para-nitrobenzyl esterase